MNTDEMPLRIPGAFERTPRPLFKPGSVPPPHSDPEERELARFRLHLVKHKSALKNRVRPTLINFGKPARSPAASGSSAESSLHDSRSRSPGEATSLRAWS